MQLNRRIIYAALQRWAPSTLTLEETVEGGTEKNTDVRAHVKCARARVCICVILQSSVISGNGQHLSGIKVTLFDCAN